MTPSRLFWLLPLALPLVAPPPATASSETSAGPTNRLASESSPYLRLHAHNPVDWYPWGEEALERARREGRPIFLSVGYSTCYWCHVMEREVFSDPAIAELMNRWFVNVKVDREERPELDEIYMTATQLLTGHGGWPNSVFLTPDLEPFFAGTYFPPEDRAGRPGFPTVLRALERAWRERRGDVEAQAGRVAAALEKALAAGRRPAAEVPGPAAAQQAVDQLKARYDSEWGGFGSAQKFPSPSNLFLLWEHAEAGDAEARSMVLDTLKRMGRGAIYDQIGGGFHRYTLDAAWRVPHFEKMLYDNAHLGELLAVTAAATGEAELERLARGTFEFVLDTMRLANGAFKSAIDAETEAVEGAFYVWTRDELEAALGEEGFDLLAPIFGFDLPPNFEDDHYTVYLTGGLATHAERLRLSWAELLERLEPHLAVLESVRAQREFPLVDEKVLTDWNGMMIGALARAGQLLGEESYVEAAARAAEFVLGLREPGSGTLLHVWHEGKARIPAFLDDYAFLLRGLLALEAATGERRWLTAAAQLADELDRRLASPAGGYFQAAAAEDLLLRPLTANDGAIPSGNGIVALGLLRLAERTGEERYRHRAESLLKAFSEDLSKYPAGLATLAWAALRREARVASLPSEPTPSLAESVVRSRARAVAPSRPGASDWTAFSLDLDLEEGWHVNANPASEPFLIPTQVRGEVRRLTYPPGEKFRFAFAEGEISVYSGRVTIRGESRPGEPVSLTYQACDDRRCLPPVTRTLALE